MQYTLREFIIRIIDTARAEGMVHSKDGKHSESSVSACGDILEAVREKILKAKLGDEEQERYQTFGLHGALIPKLHVEAIAQAQLQAILKQFEEK